MTTTLKVKCLTANYSSLNNPGVPPGIVTPNPVVPNATATGSTAFLTFEVLESSDGNSYDNISFTVRNVTDSMDYFPMKTYTIVISPSE